MNEGSGKFWNKFKTSTKSLSSSFPHVSTKIETDGDSPTSTVVHKALVKYYKNQEPFTGFPGWLGHKEDLPDEQKILRKQTEQLEKQNRQHSRFSDFKTSVASAHPTQQHPHYASFERRTKASTAFHNIYSNEPEQNRSESEPIENNTNQLSTRSSSSRSNRLGRPTWSSNSTPVSRSGSNNENIRPELSYQSSQLMTERLRRKARDRL